MNDIKNETLVTKSNTKDANDDLIASLGLTAPNSPGLCQAMPNTSLSPAPTLTKVAVDLSSTQQASSTCFGTLRSAITNRDTANKNNNAKIAETFIRVRSEIGALENRIFTAIKEEIFLPSTPNPLVYTGDNVVTISENDLFDKKGYSYITISDTATKNCAPLQINNSGSMYRQFSPIRATNAQAFLVKIFALKRTIKEYNLATDIGAGDGLNQSVGMRDIDVTDLHIQFWKANDDAKDIADLDFKAKTGNIYLPIVSEDFVQDSEANSVVTYSMVFKDVRLTKAIPSSDELSLRARSVNFINSEEEGSYNPTMSLNPFIQIEGSISGTSKYSKAPKIIVNYTEGLETDFPNLLERLNSRPEIFSLRLIKVNTGAHTQMLGAHTGSTAAGSIIDSKVSNVQTCLAPDA